MKEERIHELFREMRDEAVPADSLRRVQLGVAEKTQPRFAWWRWGVAAVLAACVVLAVFLWPGQKEVVVMPPQREVARQVETRPPMVEPVPVVQPVKRPARRVKVPKGDSGVVIRIETPDPDVVILLIGD